MQCGQVMEIMEIMEVLPATSVFGKSGIADK
jgi:hypothetical protein